MPGYFFHSHQIRRVRNIFIICVLSVVNLFPLSFPSGESQCVKRNQASAVKDISLFYVQFGRQTIFFHYGAL